MDNIFIVSNVLNKTHIRSYVLDIGSTVMEKAQAFFNEWIRHIYRL
jgi:hypothetical protein